jgi:hypothetical protein
MVNAPMGWKEVQFVSRSEILGITFGHELSPEEIWEEKMTRFELKAKIARYFSKLTPTKGVIYANVYLLPIIGFVGQFYTVPLEIERRVRTSLAKLILPQAPKVLNEQILFASYEVGGLPIRVRDFVSEANAAIIRNLGRMYADASIAAGLLTPLAKSYDRHELDPFRSVEIVISACTHARGEIGKCFEDKHYSPSQKALYDAMALEFDQKRSDEWRTLLRKHILKRIRNSPWEWEKEVVDLSTKKDCLLEDDLIYRHYEDARRGILAKGGAIRRFVWRSQASFLCGGAPTEAARQAYFKRIPLLPIQQNGEYAEDFNERSERYRREIAALDATKAERETLRQCKLCGGSTDDIEHLFTMCYPILEGIQKVHAWVEEDTRKIAREGLSTMIQDDPNSLRHRTNFLAITFNEMLGIVPIKDECMFRVAHLHVLTSAIWDVRNQNSY